MLWAVVQESVAIKNLHNPCLSRVGVILHRTQPFHASHNLPTMK